MVEWSGVCPFLEKTCSSRSTPSSTMEFHLDTWFLIHEHRMSSSPSQPAVASTYCYHTGRPRPYIDGARNTGYCNGSGWKQGSYYFQEEHRSGTETLAQPGSLRREKSNSNMSQHILETILYYLHFAFSFDSCPQKNKPLYFCARCLMKHLHRGKEQSWC